MTIAPFTYRSRAVDVRFGRGAAAENVRSWVEEHDARRILLVASASQSGTADRFAAVLDDRVRARFSGVVEHVPGPTADAAHRAAVDTDADLVLSIGGGSTTGTAKAVALRTALPILAVPTTLAGSEMTDTWGITIDGRKRIGRDAAVLPRGVVYDSALLDSLPARLAVTSGFNALAHCVEAFWGPNANPLSALTAAEGVRALARGLRGVVREHDGERDALQYGSFLAGRVFAEAGSGLHHKICHVLGGAFDLPHAATHTVILPRVLEFNAPVVPAAAAVIACALDADDAVGALNDLITETGAPCFLRELGMRAGDVAVAADLVAETLPISNPREVTRAGVGQMLAAAYDGEVRPR